MIFYTMPGQMQFRMFTHFVTCHRHHHHRHRRSRREDILLSYCKGFSGSFEVPI